MDPFMLVIPGLANGSMYALLALGLVLIFKSQDMVQFAFGEFFMVGAFMSFTAHVYWGLPFPIAFVVAVLSVSALGMAVERGLIRPIANSPHVTLVMVTVGLSFCIKGAARIPFGGDIYTLPPIMSNDPIDVMGSMVAPQSLFVIGLSALFMLMLMVLFGYTRIGKQMRATAESLTGARLVGVNIGRVFATTWGLSSAMGAAAGVMAAPITLLYPDMGTRLLLKAFAAAVLGGFGSIPGAIVAALLIGVSEMFVGFYVDTKVIDISTFLIIMLVLILRPKGLFGVADVKRL